MAKKLHIDGPSYNGRKMYLDCVQEADIAANSSKITWTLTVANNTNDGSSWVSTGPTEVVINGSTVYSKDRVDWSTGKFPAAAGTKTGTITIPHNADGTLTIKVELSSAIYYSTVKYYYDDWELNAIPREATITDAPNFTDEENPTLSYSNPAGSAVLELQACIATGDGSKQLAKYRDIPKDKTSYTFNLTDEERAALCAASPNSTTMEVSFYIKTKLSEDNEIKHYLTKKLTIVNSAPDLSAVVVDVNEEAFKLTDDVAKLIKFYSNAGCEMNATAKKGATITKTSIAHNGKTVNNKTSTTFDAVENATFTFSATDSRGLNTKKTVKLSLVEYVVLTADINTTITLNDSDGTKATIFFTISGNYFNDTFGKTKNNLNLSYAVSGGEFDEEDIISISKSKITFEDGTYSVSGTIEDVDYDGLYQIIVYADDAITLVEAHSKQLQALPVFDWSATDFNFNVPVAIKGNVILDYIVEEGEEAMGTNGTWHWEKWASGKAVCYGVRNYGNMAITSAWGNLYISSIFTQNLPSGLFADAPYVCHVDMYGNDSSSAWAMRKTRPTASDSGQFYIIRATSATLSQVYVSFYAIGRWK